MGSLCGAHHRRVHYGSLCMEGSASSGFTFRHVDGTPYGQPLEPARVDVAQQVFSALRHMGLKHTQARATIDAVLRAGAPQDLEAFLRAGLLVSK